MKYFALRHAAWLGDLMILVKNSDFLKNALTCSQGWTVYQCNKNISNFEIDEIPRKFSKSTVQFQMAIYLIHKRKNSILTMT